MEWYDLYTLRDQPEMSELLTDHIVHLIFDATVFVVIGGVAGLFGWVEDGLSPEKRKELSAWLKGLRLDTGTKSWTALFPTLIDRIFGQRALSLKFILRSCIASTFALFTVALFWFRAEGDTLRDVVSAGFTTAFYAWLVGAAANFGPDYVSLLISRWMVKVMARHPNPLPVSALLLADLGLTALNAILSVFVGLFVWAWSTDWSHPAIAAYYSFEKLVSLEWTGLVKAPGLFGFLTEMMLICFFAAFFASVWVWLYIMSAVLIRMLYGMQIFWQLLLPFLNIDEKPLGSIGKVAGLLAGTLYICLLLVSSLPRLLHR
jgi:hypothetical protein